MQYGGHANPIDVPAASRPAATQVGNPEIHNFYVPGTTALLFGSAHASADSPTLTSPARYLLSPFQQRLTPSNHVHVVSPSTILYEPKPLWPVQTRAEAELLRHFIDELGPQLDVTDPLSHFTTVVPQRAAHCVLLYHAIISAASIHRSRVFNVPDALSAEHQAKCRRILIQFLNDPDYLLDDNFLATIVVLRKGEEMSGKFFDLAGYADASRGKYKADITGPSHRQ